MSCHHNNLSYCADIVPDGEDTHGHTKCFVRLNDDMGHGFLEGDKCDVGCAICRDFPAELILHAAYVVRNDVFHGVQLHYMDALTPDARGYIHSIDTRESHLVTPFTRYVRAACHKQDHTGKTLACTHPINDVPCTCWPGADHVIDAGGCGGIPVDGIISGLVPDGLFFSGRWPARNVTGESHWQQIQCRKFWESPLACVIAKSERGNTIFLRSSLGWHGQACACDWLVPGAGYVPHSECGDSYAYQWYDEIAQIEHPGHYGEQYMSTQSSSCSNLFDRIAITHDAHFAELDDPIIDPRVIAIQNDVLDLIGIHQFPDILFDLLDHEAPRIGNGDNGHLGLYSREWDGTDYGINDIRLPVIATFPHSRTAFFDEPALVELVVVRVLVEADVQLYHNRQMRRPDAPLHGYRADYVSPHSIVRIRAWMGLRITIDGEQSYVQYADNLARWPTIQPAGNDILCAQEEGKFFTPPSCVDWHGVLNNFSVPSLHDQGYTCDENGNNLVTMDMAGNEYWWNCKQAARVCDWWIVPARQGLVDTETDGDGFNAWAGHCKLSFKQTPGFWDCVG